MANEAFSLKSVRWAGWATVTYGRVGKLKTRVGKRKKNFRRFAPNFAHPGLKPCRCPCYVAGGIYRHFGVNFSWQYLLPLTLQTQCNALFRQTSIMCSQCRPLLNIHGWVTAKRTGTQGQQGHTRPCPNPYRYPKLNPNPKP